MFFTTITLIAKERDIYRIYYRSPYGCTHEVLLDDYGNGIIKAGIVDSFDKNEIHFKQIVKEKTFKVSISDFKQIKLLISEINKPILKEVINDGFQYVLVVNTTTRINVFGVMPQVLNDITITLSKYYSFKLDWSCEGYISTMN